MTTFDKTDQIFANGLAMIVAIGIGAIGFVLLVLFVDKAMPMVLKAFKRIFKF